MTKRAKNHCVWLYAIKKERERKKWKTGRKEEKRGIKHGRERTEKGRKHRGQGSRKSFLWDLPGLSTLCWESCSVQGAIWFYFLGVTVLLHPALTLSSDLSVLSPKEVRPQESESKPEVVPDQWYGLHSVPCQVIHWSPYTTNVTGFRNRVFKVIKFK